MANLLDWIVKERGKPQAIRVDNGPEFTSSAFTGWCDKQRIEILYIQPGKPVQNAYIERFNRTYRTEAGCENLPQHSRSTGNNTGLDPALQSSPPA